MGSSVITQVPQAAKIAALLAKEVVDAIIKALEAQENSSAVKALLSDYKATGDIDVRSCEGYIRDGLERALTEESIPYAFVQDEKTGVVFLASRKSDRAIIDEIATGFIRKDSNIVSQQQLRASAAGSKVYGFNTPNAIQESVLQEQALRRNIVISKSTVGETTMFLYDAKDRDSMLIAGAKAAMLTTGVLGERSAFDAEAKTRRVSDMVERATKASVTGDAFYITSAASPAIMAKITAEGMTVYHGDSVKETIDKKNPNYSQRVREFAESTPNPVALSPHRVEGKTTEDVLAAARQERSAPPVSEATREAIIREQDARFLIETKLSLNNGMGHKYIMDFLNNKMSYGDFFEWEMRNDEHEDAKLIDKAKEIIEKRERNAEESEKFHACVEQKIRDARELLQTEHEVTPELESHRDDTYLGDASGYDDVNSFITPDDTSDEYRGEEVGD